MVHEDKNITPKDYDEYYSRVGFLVDDRVKRIISLCPDAETILDLGGGPGNVSGMLKGNVIVVDWSNQANKIRSPNIVYIKQNILDFLKNTNQSFDLVIVADVIEELRADQTKDLIAGLKKVAKKYLVISTPTHENYLKMSTHQVIYSKEELLEMLKDWELKKEINYSDRLVARFERIQ